MTDILTRDNGFSTAFSGVANSNDPSRRERENAHSRTGSNSSQSNATPLLNTQFSQYRMPTPHSPANAHFPQRYPQQMPPDGRFPADPPAWACGAPATSDASLVSPPYSAGPIPRSMSFGFPPAAPSSFLDPIQTQHDPHDPFGQITPPVDPGGSSFETQLQQQQMLHHQQQHMANAESPYGPSRNITPDHSSQAISRRPRKYNPRHARALSVEHDSEGDVRRSKFLERNRVAASKCRQKKKEQQRELENAARRLQRENGVLRGDRSTMLEEIKFLKNQVALLRKSCNCTRLSGDTRRHSLPDSNTVDDVRLKVEPDDESDWEASRLRIGSVGDMCSEANENEDEDGLLESDMKPVDEHELRTLLTDSINNEDSGDDSSPGQMDPHHLES